MMETAREFLVVLVGLCVFFVAYRLERDLVGPWRERRRNRRIAQMNSARIAREILEARTYFRVIKKNGRTNRRRPA